VPSSITLEVKRRLTEVCSSERPEDLEVLIFHRMRYTKYRDEVILILSVAMIRVECLRRLSCIDIARLNGTSGGCQDGDGAEQIYL